VLEEILSRFGVEVTFVDGTDLAQWKKAIRNDTKVVFFESLSNPTLEVIDIAAVSELAHAKGAKVLVDNVFTTPVWSRAFEQGADVVIYSATKHIDGQGRALGGVILGDRDYIRKTVEPYMKHTGGSMSPFTAWVMLKGLETMDLRVRAQTTNATTLAQCLHGHENLSQVIYPGHESHPQNDLVTRQMEQGGTVLSIDIKGGKDAAFRFLNAIEVGVISNNLGDAKTIMTHPATTTHQRLPEAQRDALGITSGLVRISLGLEDPEDICADVLQALDLA
jgi:O-succinylhomoserine sulfhydrylase